MPNPDHSSAAPGRRAICIRFTAASRPRVCRVLLAMVLLCVAHAAPAASWQRAPEVVYIDAGSPFPEQQVQAAIRYAVDAWSARVGLPMQYVDAPAAPGYQQGRIVVRWLDTLEMVENGSNILSLAATRRWVYTSSDEIAGVEIYLHRESFRQRGADACFTHAVLHEMGHALGISHLAEPAAVMHASLGTCKHTLTIEDVAAAPYQQHLCHAELLANRDIYLPVININNQSFSGRLRFDEGRWFVTDYRQVNYHPECIDAYLDAEDLILNKVWTTDYTWKAVLSPDNSGHWLLKFAF